MLVCCSQPWRHMSLWTELQLNYIFCFLLSLETFLIQTNLSRFSQFIKRSVSLGAASSPVFSILVKRLCLYQSLLNLNKDLISVYWLVGCKCPGNLHFLQLLWHWKVQSQYGLIQVWTGRALFLQKESVHLHDSGRKEQHNSSININKLNMIWFWKTSNTTQDEADSDLRCFANAQMLL